MADQNNKERDACWARELEKLKVIATPYVPAPRMQELRDQFSEGKSLILSIIAQLRPGMDLTRVIVPTHVLEQRSLLVRMVEYFVHIDLISKAALLDDPIERLLGAMKWLVSGFYNMPAIPKKPFNPILGEFFRTCWILNPVTKTKILMVAEQTSHHPPITAFYIVDRVAGWQINATVEFRARFWGTSVGAIIAGYGTLDFFRHGEKIKFTFPTCVAKGYVFPPLTMEYDGKIEFTKEGSDEKGFVQFLMKPFFGGEYNRVTGEVRKGDNLLYTLGGRFDKTISITDNRTKETKPFWEVTEGTKATQPQRYNVPLEKQLPFESENLWRHVIAAMEKGDQETAMEEKDKLEVQQRLDKAEREAKGEEWKPKFFTPCEDDPTASPTHYVYNYQLNSLFDSATDEEDIEADFKLYTVPKVRPELLCAPALKSASEAKAIKDQEYTKLCAPIVDPEIVNKLGDEVIMFQPRITLAGAAKMGTPSKAEAKE